jgi:hypothetical protein
VVVKELTLNNYKRELAGLSNDVNIEIERTIDHSVPALAYDGGSIRVPMEFHDEAVAWFTKHMGWIIQHQFDDISNDESNSVIRDRKTILGFGTCIHSIDYRDKVEPLHKDLSIETYVRWCWRTRDLTATRTYLQQEGVKVSDLYRGPGDTEYFDFWATDHYIGLGNIATVYIPVSYFCKKWYENVLGLNWGGHCLN